MKISSVSRVSFLLAAVALSWASPALGSDEFPTEIQNHLGMPCPPPCTICHKDLLGGSGTTDKPFVAAMLISGGLIGEKPETVAPALDGVEQDAVDSDMDGVGDVEELRQNRNPNVDGRTKSDALDCAVTPTYGCGARVAGRAPVDGTAAALALAGAAVLIGLSRRRR